MQGNIFDIVTDNSHERARHRDVVQNIFIALVVCCFRLVGASKKHTYEQSPATNTKLPELKRGRN